jgi:hypothetical protein
MVYMTTQEFKAVLKRLEELYAAAGLTAPAKDVRSVASLLDGSEGNTLEEFISETKALLERQPSTAVELTVDEGRVAEHSARLLSAGTDQAAFQAALDALDADRGLGAPEWYAIANHYRNTPSGGDHVYRFKSVKAARASIRDVFIERFESQSKRSVLDRILRWAS